MLSGEQSSGHRRLTVLDPFMGSGTTAVEAALQGIDAFGLELDPFARLVTEVSTRPYSESELSRLQALKSTVANTWKSITPDSSLAPRLTGIERWFDGEKFDELLSLKSAVYECAASNTDLDFFRVVLADVIRPCSKAERQSLKPYISTKYKKVEADVRLTFDKSFDAHLSALREFSTAIRDKPSEFQWVGHNATNFHLDNEVDVAITSPPYINALDYIRCIKLESAWVDCSDDTGLRVLRKHQVGDNARRSIQIEPMVDAVVSETVDLIATTDRVRSETVRAYFQDIANNLRATFRALRTNGVYHMIVGDSVIKGMEVPTHKLIADIAQRCQFEWVGYYRYSIRDHRTSIPRNGQGGKIRDEHVISLLKP
jgi:hypothetical protein